MIKQEDIMKKLSSNALCFPMRMSSYVVIPLSYLIGIVRGERSALRGWREALCSQIKPSPVQQNKLLKKISETCLYYFRCTPHYPEPVKSISDQFVPSSAEEEAVLASLMLQNDQSDTKVYDDLLFCLGTQNALGYSITVSTGMSVYEFLVTLLYRVWKRQLLFIATTSIFGRNLCYVYLLEAKKNRRLLLFNKFLK